MNTNYLNKNIYTSGSLDISEWDIDFHKLMLNDKVRMLAFEKAIKESIQPGMVVCDIGTGTGILSKWAIEAGAKKVYGVEVNPKLLQIADKELSKFGNAFVPILGMSNKITIPEKVDCIISEILGNVMDNENAPQILMDAEKRFLKKNGLMIPKKTTSFIVPVDHKEAHMMIGKKNIKKTHKDSSFIKRVMNSKKSLYDFYYDSLINKNQYLSDPLIASFMAKNSYTNEYSKELTYKIKKEGIFTGFKGYFKSHLNERVTLDIESSGDYSTSWKHAYFPIEKIIQVKKNDKLKLIFKRKKDSTYSWSGTITRNNKVISRFSQSMDALM